jgi:hypothetical protein
MDFDGSDEDLERMIRPMASDALRKLVRLQHAVVRCLLRGDVAEVRSIIERITTAADN